MSIAAEHQSYANSQQKKTLFAILPAKSLPQKYPYDNSESQENPHVVPADICPQGKPQKKRQFLVVMSALYMIYFMMLRLSDTNINVNIL